MKEKKLGFKKNTLDNLNPFLTKHDQRRARGGSDAQTTCNDPGGTTNTPVYC